MMKFVQKYHLVYKEDFDKAKAELEDKHNSLTNEIRKLYSELNELEADAKQFQKYLDNQKAHQQYVTTLNTDVKYDLTEANKNYESALIYFKRNEIKPSKVTNKNLLQMLHRIDELKSKLEGLKEERNGIKTDIRQLDVIQKNNEKLFGEEMPRDEHSATQEKEQDQR